MLSHPEVTGNAGGNDVPPAARLCLSPLGIEFGPAGKVYLAGPWCLNSQTVEALKRSGAEYEVIGARTLSREEFRHEAEECLSVYSKYLRILAGEFNRLHGTAFSERYWNTLLNRFLYPLVASAMDKYLLLKRIAETHPGISADLIDYREPWISLHSIPGFGASRLLHFLVFSIVADKTAFVSTRVLDSAVIRRALEQMGDGKKDLKGKKGGRRSGTQALVRLLKERMTWLSAGKRFLKGELALWAARYVRPTVLALGDQYLEPARIRELLAKAGGRPFYFNAQVWNTREFEPLDPEARAGIRFPAPESPLDVALQECLRVLLPTVYIENFDKARELTRAILPAERTVILNSQHCEGREVVDFFIAHSVEERQSRHVMVCHGGCFGAMEISVQDRIWSQISDSYALWSNPKSYGPGCEFVKMPSLRFHKWQGFTENRPLGRDITVFLTGHYPSRYAYNSIFPYTIDDTYDAWQIRFLSAISGKYRPSLVIRDYHRSLDISQANVQAWAEAAGIRIDASPPIAEALRRSRLAIQTVPQTTYLETISADHPTLCFWNPEANMIRADLQPFYDRLIAAGVLHLSPESAARALNEIADDPSSWWRSPAVRDAVREFRDNVCYTAPDAIDQWARFVSSRSVA